jgi:cobalt-zinc-cadmium efflux system outer membrane protein
MSRPGCVLASTIALWMSAQGIHAQQAPPALTLDAAIQEALDHNPALVAERANVAVAEAAIVTAGLRPNPVATAGLLRPSASLVAAGVSPTDESFRTDVPIERGGKRDRRIETATLGRTVAQLQLQNAIRLLLLDIETAFSDVQLATLDLELARESLVGFNDVVTINVERVRTGDLAQIELTRSRLAAMQFANDVRQRETHLAVARSRLSTLLGRGPDGSSIAVAGDLRSDAPDWTLDGVQQRAMANRPDLLAARSDQVRSTADLRLQVANGKVDYTVSGEYHRQQGLSTSGNMAGVFLSVPLPLFNRNQGEIARATVQQEQLTSRTRALEAQIANEAATAFAQYAAARDVVHAIEGQMLTQARDVRTTTEYAYRRGEASFVEFLDAVRAFNETMQSYNQARADYARSLFEIDAIVGKERP